MEDPNEMVSVREFYDKPENNWEFWIEDELVLSGPLSDRAELFNNLPDIATTSEGYPLTASAYLSITDFKKAKESRLSEYTYYKYRIEGLLSDLNRDEDTVIVNFRNQCEKFLEYLKEQTAGN